MSSGFSQLKFEKFLLIFTRMSIEMDDLFENRFLINLRMASVDIGHNEKIMKAQISPSPLKVSIP